MIRRTLLLSSVSAITVVTFASPALAHIDPDPTEAQAGSTLSVAFTVEHGCDGSPTIQLDMRLPDGVTGASPDPIPGWEGSIDADVVTFAGGPLPDDEEGTFSVTMTLPSTPDTTVYFPFVQRCEVGEIRWIAIPTDDSGAEPEEPAPAMLLTGPVATTTTPATTTPSTTTPSATATTTAPATAPEAATTVAATSAPTDTPPSTEVATVGVDENGSQDTGTWFFVASIAAVLGLGAFVAWRARSARRADEAG